MTFSTCDFCDEHKDDHSGEFRVLPPVFQHFGGHQSFFGEIVTVKCHEDNSVVKQILEQERGLGRVLVIDGAGATARSLVGGKIALAAANNGWSGLLVYGAVRDRAELSAIALGVCALALTPMPTSRAGQGQRDVSVSLQGIVLRPGEWLYADADGIVIFPRPLHTIS